MKKIIISTFLLFIGVFFLESFKPLKIMKKDGAAPGYTGSPGDSLKNCTACHGGIATHVLKWMRSNVPQDGYIPGNTYTITAINKVVGATRFGFECSPQDSIGNLIGSMIVTDTATTKFVGGNKYITYTSNGVGSIDSMKWSFDWVAPATGTRDVKFYGAFNSNFNHNKSNDQTFIGTMLLKENLNNSITTLDKKLATFNIYPNPANDYIDINYELNNMSNISIEIIDLNGKTIQTILHEKQQGLINIQVNTQNLKSGNYLVRMNSGGKTMVRKVTITH